MPVLSIPGCCAAVNALAVSGLPTGRFTFEGFLTVNKKSRRERLEQLRNEERTMIFHEAPHKLRTTLDDLCEAFGPERRIALCRELTKLHEETMRTTLGAAVDHYRENSPKGEYVLVVEGAPPQNRRRRNAGGWRCPGAGPAGAGHAAQGCRPGKWQPTPDFPKTSSTPPRWSNKKPPASARRQTRGVIRIRSQILKVLQAGRTDIFPFEYYNILCGVTENTAGFVFFQNDRRALHIDFQCILSAISKVRRISMAVQSGPNSSTFLTIPVVSQYDSFSHLN